MDWIDLAQDRYRWRTLVIWKVDQRLALILVIVLEFVVGQISEV